MFIKNMQSCFENSKTFLVCPLTIPLILSIYLKPFYVQMIRGRLCDDSKPETFNQLWTVEEQVPDALLASLG